MLTLTGSIKPSNSQWETLMHGKFTSMHHVVTSLLSKVSEYPHTTIDLKVALADGDQEIERVKISDWPSTISGMLLNKLNFLQEVV